MKRDSRKHHFVIVIIIDTAITNMFSLRHFIEFGHVRIYVVLIVRRRHQVESSA